MPTRAAISRITVVAMVVGWSLGPAATVVRGDPPPITTAIGASSSLDQGDRAVIDGYAEFWTAALLAGADDPGAVRRVRRSLWDPLGRGGVTEVFRTTYGAALEPGLRRVLAEGNAHTTSVALVVLAKLQTVDALEELLRHVDVNDEPRRHVRLGAARGCSQIFEGDGLSNAKPTKITNAVRQLRDAAMAEPDRLTLRHQLEAILAADDPALPEAARGQIHAAFVATLDATAQRAAAAPSDALALLDATYTVLYKIRIALLDPTNLDPAAQRNVGRQLGPSLGRMLEVARAHWADIQSTPRAKERFGEIISLCERVLTTTDTFVRPNSSTMNTRLKEYWDQGDEGRYGADLKRWKDILGKPPY
jgi:hypothetical protein